MSLMLDGDNDTVIHPESAFKNITVSKLINASRHACVPRDVERGMCEGRIPCADIKRCTHLTESLDGLRLTAAVLSEDVR